jgi:hypothetical protein
MKRASLYGYSDGGRFAGQSPREVFTSIAAANAWGNAESISGHGSSTDQTAEIVRLLPSIFQEFSITSVFDIPCGDFNWFRRIISPGIAYLGGDIVEGIVERNARLFPGEGIRFTNFDLLTQTPEPTDLVFCRDCLVHLSLSDASTAIANIARSGSKYFMTTTFPMEEENEDIQTGGWRPLNFLLPPFSFPPPLLLINERCTEMDGVFADKSLGLWKLDNLR